MKVIEHIQKTQNSNSGAQFSFEIVPPPRGRSVKDIIDIAESLVPLDPQWIDVTTHASSAYYHEKPDGQIEKRIFRKRPGTLGICGIIQNRFKIDTVAHVLCEGFSKEETEDALIELSFLGIHNVLALRGDTNNISGQVKLKKSSVNNYAIDLVRQIKNLQSGHFLDEVVEAEPIDFCIGVAGYPEKHFEAPSLKVDLMHLKSKVDAGAEYIVTQICYDNQKFFEFVKSCRAIGIQVPIIPGIKILKSTQQLKSIPKNFYIHFPDELVEPILKNPKNVLEIGQEWCTKQVRELIEHGYKNIHFYVMNDVEVVAETIQSLKK